MRSRFAVAITALACLCALQRTAAAQTLTGTVFLPDSTSAAAQVLVEVAVGPRAPIRLLTDRRGVFRTRLIAADTVRVRVLRPGFRPHVPPTMVVAAGETRDLRVVLSDQPVTIAAVSVVESRICGARADAAAWQLWEQARTVLQSIELTERDSALKVWTVEFQGDATPDGSVAVKDSTIRQVPIEPPFPPVYYDSLFREGYIRRVGDTTTYYAPNASVLADERFVESHCFRLADADSAPAGLIGVRFEPQRLPRATGIAGTFWLDAESYLLRRIDFAYVNAPANHRTGTGGHVHFTQLSSGHWVLDQWAIRMAGPILTRYHHQRERLRSRGVGPFLQDRRAEPLHGDELQWDGGVWVRSRMVYRVQQDETTLLYVPEGDALARRQLPEGRPAPRPTRRIWRP